LAPLVERKRYLRLPMLRLFLPRPARQPDSRRAARYRLPADALGAGITAAIGKVLGAVGRGEIAPAEALRLGRRSRKPLRAMRRQLWRDLARLEAMRRDPGAAGKLPDIRKKFPVLRESRPAPRCA
jgi:hypothetical protein